MGDALGRWKQLQQEDFNTHGEEKGSHPGRQGAYSKEAGAQQLGWVERGSQKPLLSRLHLLPGGATLGSQHATARSAFPLAH